MESKVNDYQLRQGDRIYVFSTSIVDNLIRLSCKNHSGKSYSRDFTVYDINAIDPIFSEIQTESDAIKFIDKALGKFKVGVIEESGVIKIIFYIQTKGLIHSVEIPLGESGKSFLQSNIDNLNTDNNALSSTTQFDQTGQPIEIAPQTYGNSSYSIGNMNSYGQQSFYPPIITPIEGEISNDSNYNFNQYMSQYQTNGGNGFYENTTQFETGTGFTGTNLENLGSFIQQNNSQYIQYDSTNDFSGALMSSNDYNSNTYEYPSNQYTTSNNYFSTNYDTSYQGTSTSYDANSYNYPTTYTNTTNEYYQSAIEETAYNGQEFQTYENTASVTSLNNNILPTMDQSEPVDTNKNNESGQHESDTNQVVSSDKGANVISNSQNEQGIQEETAISTKITDANDNKKSLQQSASAAQSNIKSSQNLKAQKESVSPKTNINESELKKLKEEAAQAVVLREQLNRLQPLKKQVEDMADLKKQILELNSLREKAIELNTVKSQLAELKELRQQVGQMNILRQQLEELDSLRAQVALTESLKKRVEELEKINLEYEQEIKELRESQRQRESVNAKSNSNIMSSDLENKQVSLEEKTEQICVKGEIIHDTNELEMLTKKINKLNKKLTLNLLYKASADSDKAAAFHAKCDQANSTIVLIETDKGKRFGGYTTCSWSGECVDKKDENAFVFSLDKMKTYDNIPGEDAIGCYPKFGPIFLGCQIRIYNNAFSKGGTTFERGLNYNTEEDFELTGGDRVFNVKEIEVYEVIPQ